jgi:hypothetical protein
MKIGAKVYKVGALGWLGLNLQKRLIIWTSPQVRVKLELLNSY